MKKERKAWLQNQTITAVLFFVLFIYVFFHAIPSGGSAHWRAVSLLPVSPNSSSNQSRLKVYLYPLPRKFTYGVVEGYWTAGGHADVADLKYPSHQHSADWHLLLDLTRDKRDRFRSPAVRVSTPEEADLFYVPFFSSLSWVASKTRSLNGSVRPTKPLDAEAQEELVAWLDELEQWRRSKGRDHVVVCQNPNARRVKDRVKNAVWLVSDPGGSDRITRRWPRTRSCRTRIGLARTVEVSVLRIGKRCCSSWAIGFAQGMERKSWKHLILPVI